MKTMRTPWSSCGTSFVGNTGSLIWSVPDARICRRQRFHCGRVLCRVELGSDGLVDVAVVGAGPAGLSLAAELGQLGLSVVCLDQALSQPWPNNYGVWVHEMRRAGHEDCLAHRWESTAVYLTPPMGSPKQVFPVPYGRMDRAKMKDKLLAICERDGVRLEHENVSHVDQTASPYFSVVHFGVDSTLRARIFVDATGHSRKFAKFEPGSDPGFQAAYGIEAEVEEDHGFPLGEMVLMDYRDDYMQGSDYDRAEAERVPLFLYVMPTAKNKLFLEETSLVASPPVSFPYLKERLYKRLAHMGVTVKSVEEEEFCLIPMGGTLPVRGQRTIAFGGTAGLVHPATGYMVSNTLYMSKKFASVIHSKLSDPDKTADELADELWKEIWEKTFLRLRDFHVFGGEFLRRRSSSELREFLHAFFQIPIDLWTQFLAFDLLNPFDRVRYGLGVFFYTTNRIRALLIAEAAFLGRWPLLRSVLPLQDVERREELNIS
uniref:lycopene beta-cyclase n=1 Tax=Compsopogon caeruleus TaxID=31354 RepID=A0A7S1XD83_9RHOD